MEFGSLAAFVGVGLTLASGLAGLWVWRRRRPTRIAQELRPALEAVAEYCECMEWPSLHRPTDEIIKATRQAVGRLEHLKDRIIDKELRRSCADLRLAISSYDIPQNLSAITALGRVEPPAESRRWLRKKFHEKSTSVEEDDELKVPWENAELLKFGFSAGEAKVHVTQCLERLAHLERRSL